ncbi:mitotic checkpoint regulator, MAD2B-interacting-domain-containing protein [Aspergillus californicus]
MGLVDYSDSDASDSERETRTNSQAASAATTPKPGSSSSKAPSSIVDKSNPRKIRVALPDIKSDLQNDGEDGPARKRPRVGGGGGTFAGFSSFLPTPKRPNAATEKEKKAGLGAGVGHSRKVFSLKTGAAPGFDRGADEEMKRDMAFERLGGGGEGDDDTIPKAGSLRESDLADGEKEKKPEEVVLKGNPMMFKPLSVARTGQKKKKTMATIIPPPSSTEGGPNSQLPIQTQKPTSPPPAPKPKPKVSLFSLSSEETTTPDTSIPTPAQPSTYQPLVYTTAEDAPQAGPLPETDPTPSAAAQANTSSTQTLEHIADDLNLSRAQRRQLFGRNADASKSRILHFNTDAEYAANQEAAHEELAATQHNPVRAIAPGKHTLQQLVNAASTQKDALEESFASGKRNKKEAGARYGW